MAALMTALALDSWTISSTLQIEPVNPSPVVTPIADRAELTVRTNALVGTYATGDKPGDRTILIQPDGRVSFAEIGSSNAVLNNTDTYRLGKIGAKYCAVTKTSGVIEIFDTDTITYFRDSYRRR